MANKKRYITPLKSDNCRLEILLDDKSPFSKGFGDYTKERSELFPSDNLEELIRDIKSKRKKKKIN